MIPGKAAVLWHFLPSKLILAMSTQNRSKIFKCPSWIQICHFCAPFEPFGPKGQGFSQEMLRR